jgi:magnesium transporter
MQTASVILNNIHRASAKTGLRSPARKELAVALILGLCCALLVALPVFWLYGSTPLALSIGVTLFLGAIYVSSLAVALPFLIHRLQIDPRIATGPVVLAMADSGTLLLYLFVSLWLTR